ncbi:MAG: hypothetical protein ACI4DX_04950 [Oliverpabstia sp.]
MKVQMSDFYASLEEELNEKAEEIAMRFDRKSLKDAKVQNEALQIISENLSSVVSERSSNFCELMVAEAMKDVNLQAKESARFLGEMTIRMEDIKLSFSPNKDSQDIRKNRDVAIEARGLMEEEVRSLYGVYGIGRAIENFKKGGTIGRVASLVVPIFSESIVHFYPGWMEKLLKKDVLYVVRQKIKAAITVISESRQIENGLRDNITASYDQLYAMVNDEANHMLNETQRTIDTMKVNLSKSKFEQEQIRKDCNEIIENAESILEGIKLVLNLKI